MLTASLTAASVTTVRAFQAVIVARNCGAKKDRNAYTSRAIRDPMCTSRFNESGSRARVQMAWSRGELAGFALWRAMCTVREEVRIWSKIPSVASWFASTGIVESSRRKSRLSSPYIGSLALAFATCVAVVVLFSVARRSDQE